MARRRSAWATLRSWAGASSTEPGASARARDRADPRRSRQRDVDGDVAPDGYRIIDARGRTVMPGLIDAHVHLNSLTLPAPPRGELAYEADVRPCAQAAASRAMLEGGITTARDLGSNGRELFALRRAIGAQLCPGPRLVLCGQIVSPTSPGGRMFSSMYRQADGADEVRKAVREQIQQGADLIKIMTTGALTVSREAVEPAQMTPPEIEAIVEESHRQGFRVASHAEGLPGIELSVDAGVDTIEHGEALHRAPGVLDRMAERGIVLVPTLSVFELVAECESCCFTPKLVEQAARLREDAFTTVAAARAAGVTMVMGYDSHPHGANASELVRMVQAGHDRGGGGRRRHGRAAAACALEDVGRRGPGAARRPARRRRRPAGRHRRGRRRREALAGAARGASRRGPRTRCERSDSGGAPWVSWTARTHSSPAARAATAVPWRGCSPRGRRRRDRRPRIQDERLALRHGRPRAARRDRRGAARHGPPQRRIEADVTSAADCERMAAEAIAALGHIDILVANAGGATLARAWEITEAGMGFRQRRVPQGRVADDQVRRAAHDRARQRQDRRHVVAQRTARRARLCPLQRGQGGRIHYAKSLALELGPYGINVNVVCPTQMADRHEQREVSAGLQSYMDQVTGHANSTYEEFDAASGRDNLFEDRGQPDFSEVAEGALWLASERAGLVTGLALPMDAGWIVKRGG